MLSQKEIDNFFQNGYLIVETNIDLAILNNVIKEMEKIYSGLYSNPPSPGSRIQELWKDSISAKHLAQFPGILSMLNQLYKRKPLPFQTLKFLEQALSKPLHSDTIHFNSFPNNFMCGVWIALEDIDDENGPVCYCPGSHKLPEYNMQDVGEGKTHENYEHYEEFIRNYIYDNKLITELMPQ